MPTHSRIRDPELRVSRRLPFLRPRLREKLLRRPITNGVWDERRGGTMRLGNPTRVRGKGVQSGEQFSAATTMYRDAARDAGVINDINREGTPVRTVFQRASPRRSRSTPCSCRAQRGPVPLSIHEASRAGPPGPVRSPGCAPSDPVAERAR